MHNIEPVNVSIWVMSIVLAPQLAEVIGPYAVIVLASTIGASWSLGGKEPLTKLEAVWYFTRVNLTAVLITVALANFIGQKLGYSEGKWLLAPIAMFIGIIGNEWGTIARWLNNKIHRILDRIVGDH